MFSDVVDYGNFTDKRVVFNALIKLSLGIASIGAVLKNV